MPDLITDNTATPQQGGAPPAGEQPPAESKQQPKQDERFTPFAFKKLQDERDSLKQRVDALESGKQSDSADVAKRIDELAKQVADEKAAREAAEKQAALATKRGAVSTELLKLGVDPGVTDLIDLGTIEDGGKNAADIAKRIASSIGTGKSGAPYPTPTPNPGGAPNFDPSKATADDIYAGKHSTEQLRQIVKSAKDGIANRR